MVYKQQFAAAIKVANKTLRENGKQVRLPFKSEYSIFLKNQNNVKALINISIDGNHITPHGLVLKGGESVDLERFLETNRKLKFIERTSAIASHLGTNVADSTIVIKYSFEKIKQTVETVFIKGQDIHHYHDRYVYPRPFLPSPYRPNDIWYGASVGGNLESSDNSRGISANSVNLNANFTANVSTATDDGIISFAAPPENEVGITVEGSESFQKIESVSGFAVESEEYTIEFELVGGESVTTKSKRICKSCGKKVKSKYDYCPDDGTYLG